MSRPYIIFTLAYTSCISASEADRTQSIQESIGQDYIVCRGTSGIQLTQYLIQTDTLSPEIYTEIYNNLNSISGRKIYRDSSTGRYYDANSGDELQGIDDTLRAVQGAAGIVRMSASSPGSTISFFLIIEDYRLS